MSETAAEAGGRVEFEVRGGLWESAHVVIFYGSVISAVLATVGIWRVPLGISCIVILFYSMFAIFSSPTYVISEPGTQALTLERYYYFIPRRKRLDRDGLEGLEVVESPRVPSAREEKGARRDLSYFVRVYLRRSGGRRLKLFGSGMTGAPAENRAKAFLIAQRLAGDLDIPVYYTRHGADEEGRVERGERR